MKYIYIFVLTLFVSLSIQAQEKVLSEGDKVKITTVDGNEYSGEIVEINTEKVTIRSQSTVDITIKHIDIRELVAIDTAELEMQEFDKNGHPIDFHNSTHYLANPSAYGLKKGQAYYENIGVFFNSFAFGVTDNFSIAVGGEIASLLFGPQIPIIYVSPKLSLPSKNEKIAFSIGGTLFTAPQGDFRSFGILQGAVTVGGRNNNFTLGTGFGFDFSNGFSDSILPFYASFMTRLTRRLSLVSDNFIIYSNDFDYTLGVLSLALRYHFKKNGAVFNAGLFRPTEDIEIIGIPFISATVPLGK